METLTVKPPLPGELTRVLRLFGNERIRPDAQVVVAVKPKPVERFVGALAGWMEGEYGRFLLGCLPGTARTEAAHALIQHVAVTARAAGLRHLMYGKLLGEKDETYALLMERGFYVMRSERFFQIEYDISIPRVKELVARYKDMIPESWHTESIRHQPPKKILDLVAEHRLMPEEEILAGWRWGERNAFEPDLSSIIYDQADAFGTLLVRRREDIISYDVRVVRHPDLRMRGLANVCLFHHCLAHYDGSYPVRWGQFRGGETEHRETANLAMRMGAKELAPLHVLAMAL